MKLKPMQEEKLVLAAEIDWAAAREGLLAMKERINSEIAQLESSEELRHSYSSKTWMKLCGHLDHALDGMSAVRLRTSGLHPDQVAKATCQSKTRVAAFLAWNTRWVKTKLYGYSIEFREEHERERKMGFLRRVGIQVISSRGRKEKVVNR